MTERLLVSGRHHPLCSVEWTRETIERGGSFVSAPREGLQTLGWTDGRNVRIDTRWAAPGNVEALQLGAKELCYATTR